MTFDLIIPSKDLTWIGCAKVMSLTRMHVHYRSIGDVLQELCRQLLCEHDSWSHHHNRLRNAIGKLSDCIENHGWSLTSSSGHEHLTFAVLLHSTVSTVLMGTKNHGFHCVWSHYSIKKPPVMGVWWTVLKVSYRSLKPHLQTRQRYSSSILVECQGCRTDTDNSEC